MRYVNCTLFMFFRVLFLRSLEVGLGVKDVADSQSLKLGGLLVYLI